MSKKTVGARLPQHLVERLETLAKVDRRSVSQIIEILIERGLPALEEHMEVAALLQEKPTAYKANSKTST